jgi:hypothetical protein
MKIWLMDVEMNCKELMESNGATSYDWSPDGKKIQVECYNGKICLIDTATFEVIQTRFTGNTVGFSPDSQLLSWDNFPPQTRTGGSLPVKQSVQYGTLYTWKEGTQFILGLIMQSYRTAGTQWLRMANRFISWILKEKALTQVMLGSRTVKHLYQFDKEICATGLSPDGNIFLVRTRVVEENTASCTGEIGLVDLINGGLVWYEDLMDVKWIWWTRDYKGLVVLLNGGAEEMIDLATGATTPTDWMNWTKFFELWYCKE